MKSIVNKYFVLESVTVQSEKLQLHMNVLLFSTGCCTMLQTSADRV